MGKSGSPDGNAATFFVDSHLAAGRGQKTAFREVDGACRDLTYAALATGSSVVAAAFAAAGLRREERIAMLCLDTIEYPQLFWGALKAGVVAVPLNTLLAPAIYDSILRDSRASALFVSAPLYPAIADIIADNPDLRTIVVIGGEAPEGSITFEAFMAGHAPAETLDVLPDETAFWLYSSGSTGQPKGVTHVHGSLQATSDTYGSQVLGIREDDIVYSAAKIFFAYGLGNAMTFPMSVGATTLLLAGRPTPDGVMAILTNEGPTLFCGVPTLFSAMLAACQGDGQVKTALRLCISAGEALPAAVGEGWLALTGVDILDGVGSTEMLHIFLSNREGDVAYGTSGVAVPGYDLRLVDEAGAEVGVGEIGELLVAGDSAADGYWNQREKSRATFEGIWTRTGDKYERAADGRLIYCGRTDDMFKVSGIWVSPFEVEQSIAAHDDVIEAAVVPATDDEGLLKPKAFVVLKADVDAGGIDEAIKAHVKADIGKWKYPRWVEIVEDLPKTATGKIQRFKLREGA
jgi:4-hydroxybenzoate-CoA ligase